MNPKLTPFFGLIPILFRLPLGLLGGVLSCTLPIAASAQSVTFAGVQTTLPFSSLNYPYDVAVDKLGNVYVADLNNNRIVELPKTAAGYGPQITLPFSGITDTAEVAVDSAEDVFAVGFDGFEPVLELPWTGSGYGPQTALPQSSAQPSVAGIAVDNARNVYVISNSQPGDDQSVGSVYEWPWSATGYGAPIALPYGGEWYTLDQPAVDGAGDVFFGVVYCQPLGNGSDNCSSFSVKLPKEGTSYGQPVQLPVGSVYAVDSAGDVFSLSGTYNNNYVMQESLWTGTTYGPFVNQALTSGLFLPGGGALDSQGDFFISDSGNNRVVEVQTKSVNFGSVNFCTSGAPAPCAETLTLNYSVTENGPLGTPKVLTNGAPGLDFTLAAGSTCAGPVTVGTFCTVNVTFAPKAVGVRNGTVEITNESGSVLATTTISGVGGGTPEAEVSPTYMAFGTIPIGTSKTLPVTVTNTGGGTLTVTPSISGYSSPAPSVYSYAIASSNCTEGLTAGTSCTLQVEYSPMSISANHDDLLTLQTNGASNPTVNLVGASAGLSVLGGLNPGTLKFGSVASGSTEVKTLTVTNVGLPGTVTIGTAIKAGYGAGPYSVLATATNTCLAGIAPGQSCTLPIKFAPVSSGTHNDFLTLTPSAGGGGTTVWLYGTTP